MIVGAGLPLAVAAKLTTAEHWPGSLFTVMLAGHAIVGAAQFIATDGDPFSGVPNELPVQFVFVRAAHVQANGEPLALEGAVAVTLIWMLSPTSRRSAFEFAVAVTTCPERLTAQE